IHPYLKQIYYPAHYAQLNYGSDRVWDRATTDAERAAIMRAWKEIVLGHAGAYLKYRWDNFRLMLGLKHVEAFSNVYVWFHRIDEPWVPDQIDHDATASRVQGHLRSAMIWLSKTPLFLVFPYVLLCLLMVPFAIRNRAALAFLASALFYEAA